MVADVSSLSNTTHPNDNYLNKNIILNRIRGRFYRTVECIGFDLVSLISFSEDDEDKEKLQNLFDYLSEE